MLQLTDNSIIWKISNREILFTFYQTTFFEICLKPVLNHYQIMIRIIKHAYKTFQCETSSYKTGPLHAATRIKCVS